MTVKNVEISIIIPVYNAGHYITDTLDSILLQSFDKWECILVNDGSTDNSEELIKKYLHLPHFHYYKIDNSGPSAARNKGVEKAKGNYLFFLDADDIIPFYCLEVLVAPFREFSSIDLVYGGVVLFRNNINNWTYAKLKTFNLEIMLLSNMLSIHCVLMKRSSFDEVGGFEKNFLTCEDWLLWLKLLVNDYKFFGVPHIVAYYRDVNNSNGKNKIQWQKDRIGILIEFYSMYKNKIEELDSILKCKIITIYEHVFAQAFWSVNKSVLYPDRIALKNIMRLYKKEILKMSYLLRLVTDLKMNLRVLAYFFLPRLRKRLLNGNFG